MNRSVSRDELEWYICDIGIDATLKMFHLTEDKADEILISKPLGESIKYNEPIRTYKPFAPPKTADSNELIRFITQNYKALRRASVRNRLVINARSLSAEDIFHNNLLSLIKGADSFRYKSDDQTKRFVSKSLKLKKFSEIKACKLHSNNMVKYRLIAKTKPTMCETIIIV